MTEKKIKQLIVRAKTLPWTDHEFYSEFMAQIFFLTSYSVKMLASAAGVTERPEYHRHLIQQIRLEIGHDKMALSDLKALGRSPEEFHEFGVTRSLWESQLYKIQRNPDTLIGYIYALEKAAVDIYGHILPAVTKAHGEKAVKFIKLHAEEDQEHVVEAMKQIEALEPSSRREALINAEQACDMLGHLFDSILEKTSRNTMAA